MKSRLKIAQKLFAIILILAIATLAGLAYPLVPVTVTGTVTAAKTNVSTTMSLVNELSLTSWVISLVSLNTYSIPQTVCQQTNCEVVYSTTIASFSYVATTVSVSVFQQPTTLRVSETSTTTFINYTSMNEPAYVTYGLNGIDFAILSGIIVVLLVGVIILGAKEKKTENDSLRNFQSRFLDV